MYDSEYLKEGQKPNDLERLRERRRKNDRRRFCYTAHSPERRSGMDRREKGTNKFKTKVA
jgi:hypothetical protein